ncbi:OLC1v1005764C1 [Oldenlandia corymbosa var. corymbosa]|uniref:Caffeic acid 3-O-methyltransferase n=1 Tax=Oldenlandia corymbosa var. corymbosa TaxID=529605 RepID=A0AAV1DGM9_OLDCO|nr:OLC1v1005764C1 [Oldenlandia corymbosa var. corymbosa]
MESSKVPNVEGGEKGRDFSYAMQLATSASFPMVLYTAIKLNLLEIISKSGPGSKLSASQITAQLATKNSNAASMVDRMLRLLSAYSVLTCDEVNDSGEDGSVHKRVYGLTPVGKYFIENEEGFSVSPLVELHNDKVFIDSWYELRNAVIEGGIPFNRVHGTHAFDYPSRDPRFNELFNKGMVGPTGIILEKILSEYKGFEQLCTLVDVGGGLGITLHKIISKYPLIKGINFDLPHVVHAAPSYPGVDHVGGDMFECVPGGDAIFMKMILHDWSDDHCLKLLKNCFNALPDGGKVIVVDLILPEKPDTSTSSKGILSSDVLMMTVNPGGRERSENEVRALAVSAGFRDSKLVTRVGSLGVTEIYK